MKSSVLAASANGSSRARLLAALRKSGMSGLFTTSIQLLERQITGDRRSPSQTSSIFTTPSLALGFLFSVLATFSRTQKKELDRCKYMIYIDIFFIYYVYLLYVLVFSLPHPSTHLPKYLSLPPRTREHSHENTRKPAPLLAFHVLENAERTQISREHKKTRRGGFFWH